MKQITEQQARKYLKELGYFVENFWSMDDINELIDQQNEDNPEEEIKPFTLKTIQPFWEFVANRLDASIGLNWEVLEIYLLEYLKQ